MNTVTQKNVLDYSLRNLYCSLRRIGDTIMAIEFEHGGKKWRADTVEEAVTLRNKLREEDLAHGIDEEYDREIRREPQFQAVWDVDTFVELMENIGPLQKLFLRELFAKGQVPSSALRKALGLDSEIALAGVISGLSKQLKGMNLSSANLYTVDVRWKGKSKTRLFSLTQGFSIAGMEAGWPDEWEKGERNAAATKAKRK